MCDINQLVIMFRGAGDLATGAALRLYGAGLRRIIFLETATPMAVRRTVSFSEAIYDGECSVEGVRAVRVEYATLRKACEKAWQQSALPVLVDPDGHSVALLRPDVLIEATLAKRNVGVKLTDAPLVIGVGPGFCAHSPNADVHRVVESQRGIRMGRLIRHGSARPNTGLPESVMGHCADRVLRASADGVFETLLDVGAWVQAGDQIGTVHDSVTAWPVRAAFDGRIRGLLRSGLAVGKGTKLGDVDPRPDADIHTVSDKSLAIGGALLEAILEHTLQGDTY